LVKKFFDTVKYWVSPILKSYSGILFIPYAKAGLALFILTFLDFNVGISGLTAILSAYLFAKFLGFSKNFLSLDYYIYNPLLVGLGIGFLFKFSLLTAIFIIVLSIFTFLLTYTASNVLSYYFKLPVLSIPFVIISVIAYLASYKYSNLFVHYLYHHAADFGSHLPKFWEGFFKSLGAIFFFPYTLPGIVIFIVLLMYSRILAFLSLIGFLLGTTFLGFMSGNFESVYSDIYSFNYILISLALGGVFLIPHPKSYLIALIGVMVSVPVVEASKVFFEHYGIPIFAIPFNTVVLLFVYTLSLLGYRYITYYYRGTPERTLDYFLTYLRRFPYQARAISLPFSGKWTVWQSFDDEWTHKGAWKHALDFVITDEEGRTYRGEGIYLTDYYAFRKPVLSPVDGVVVEVVDGFPDNPPGQADKKNNWGNYVIIYDWRGFYVLICHLAQNSIKVKTGDKVQRGTLLGLCGNSGYSPQPHIHMHVQLYPKAGSPTAPFVIGNFLVENYSLKDFSVPKKGQSIEAFFPDKVLSEKFNLLLDENYEFDVFLNDKKVGEIKLEVKMDTDASFYLTDGTSKIYFGLNNGFFYIYNFEGEDNSFLKKFFIAVSKVPLNLSKPVKWEDSLPLEIVNVGILKPVLRFLGSFYHDAYSVKSTFENKNQLEYTFKIHGTFVKEISGKVKINSKGKFVEKLEINEEGKKWVFQIKLF